MSGIEPTPQLASASKTQILQFPDSVLDKFHGFSITTLTDPEITSKWVVTEDYAAASRFHHDIWLKIFQYLTPKEIFNFVISAKGWSQCIDLNLLRNQFVLLYTHPTIPPFDKPDFVSILYDNDYCQGKLPLMHVESLLPLTLKDWATISARTIRAIPYNNVRIENTAALQAFLAQNNQQLPNLTKIDLENSEITFADLQATLRAASHLKELSLGFCKNIYSEALATLEAGSIQTLEAITLSVPYMTIEALRALLKGAPQLKKLDLRSDLQLDVLSEFSRTAPNLKEIVLNSNHETTDNVSIFLPVNSLQALEIMVISGHNVTMSNLQGILLAAPNLKELGLGANSENRIEGLPPLNHSLEKIWLQGYTANYLKALLQVAPNLKELMMIDHRIHLEASISHLESNALPTLVKFTLFKSGFSEQEYKPITTGDLQSILRVAPNLKEIEFRGKVIDNETDEINETVDFSQVPGYFFQSLTRIELSGMRLENIQCLLQTISNIKAITLAGCCIITPIDFSKLVMGSLPSLNSFYLDSIKDNLVIENLHTLLLAAPNLRAFHNSGDGRLTTGDLSQLPTNYLRFLKQLNLSLTDITIANLKALLLAAPNLEKIDLSGAQNLIPGDLVCLKEISLPKLQDINLMGTNIAIKDIQALSIAMPHLKYLNLSDCQNIAAGDLSQLGMGSLPSLENIELVNTNVTIADIQSLIQAAPYLQKLNLQGCQNIEADTLSHLEAGSLPTLKDINLWGTNVTNQDLQALFKAAPNLKWVYLYDCQNITEDIKATIPDHLTTFMPF